METKPWIYGPLELLIHGIEHFFMDTEKDYRLALIHLDNSSELAMKSFIRFHNPSLFKKIKKDWRIISRYYERIIGVIEGNVTSFPPELSSKLLYNHEIRNSLYHEALTIPRKNDVYNSIKDVIYLFKTLYSNDYETALKSNIYENILLLLIEIEIILQEICVKKHIQVTNKNIYDILKAFVVDDSFSENIEEIFKELIQEKEQLIVNLKTNIDEDKLYDILIMAEEILNELENI